MNYDEFLERFNKIIASPENGIGDAPKLLDDVKGVFANTEALGAEVARLNEQVKGLQESNVKLYLAQTESAGGSEESEMELDGEEYIDNIFEKLLKEED